MKKIVRFLKRTDHRHYVCVAITVGFILINAFCFPYSVPRLIESFRDFGLSFWHMIVELFLLALPSNVTVTSLSDMPFTVSDKIPETWELFKNNWSAFWKIFADGNNFRYYILMRRAAVANASRIILLLTMFLTLALVIVVPLLRRTSQNNDYNEDTKALKAFKRLSDKTYRPVKGWILSFIDFVKRHKVYRVLWTLTWFLSFNFFSIVVEFFAFYFYFAVSLSLPEIFVQIYKLILDLSPMYKFVPFPVWILLGIVVFDKVRKHEGYKRLLHHEMKNRGFINERGVFSLFVAPMRGGKNKAEVAFTLSREAMFRNMAYEIILNSDLKFPYFPWINLENALRNGMEKGTIYNLATVRLFLERVKRYYYTKGSVAVKKSMRRHLKKVYAYPFKDLLFEYDATRYPMYYDNAKYIEYLFEVLSDYAQAYFVYIIKSSLIISNYSIRTDSTVDDVGNFPLWDDDFFHVDSWDVDVISRHSHILNFDVLKLGKKIAGESGFSFEFGIIDITEIAKDRLNMIEAQGIKKEDDLPNQKNDGFDEWVKMCGHNATIDFTCFVSIYADEQREDQLPASLRQVGEILRIEDIKKGYLAMPWFFLDELVYSFLRRRFEKRHKKERYNKGNNTLPYYIAHSVFSKIEEKYRHTVNTFGYEKMSISVQDGAKNNEKSLHNFYISNKKDLSKRYSTDCLSDMLAVRSLRAIWGLDDEPTYRTERASCEEMVSQNSYFVNRVTEQLKAKDSAPAVEEEVSAQTENPKILFLYVNEGVVEYAEAESVADLYSYFTSGIGSLSDNDYCNILQRLQKYTVKTDPYLNIREWLSGLYLKKNIDYVRYYDLYKQVDDLQLRFSRR